MNGSLSAFHELQIDFDLVWQAFEQLCKRLIGRVIQVIHMAIASRTGTSVTNVQLTMTRPVHITSNLCG